MEAENVKKEEIQSQNSLWGQNVYLVFKCVHLEGGRDPEFQFKKAFKTETEAKAFKKTIPGMFTKFHQVVKIQVTKQTGPHSNMQWFEHCQKWAANDFRMVVSYEDIEKSIKIKK